MLQIDSVSKLYKGGDKALDNISFSVEQEIGRAHV